MHPLKKAISVKGSKEFSRNELVGLLAFTLRIMSVKEAKESIDRWIKQGLLEEREGVLLVKDEALDEAIKSEDLFEEMIEFVSSSLGLERDELMAELKEFSKRYGNLDRKLVLYLFGLDKGLDMSKFRDRLSLE
ncbi:DUF2240 family protein [Thermococcus gorgonarius]|uniref:DUF2240 domain-containing protein n=1 Tax=Thermococcus gorgonarius TaxID=71997 RepID=A0A2Z2M652_THEGO|nr:DUF2240 family protein [Thermococcus gorgonarius]ASJ00619.1 hypothetical protein A3K92_03590 [Thermococcus gorgonarius]